MQACVNGLLLQTEEEISPVACVNSYVPSPTLHALPSFKPVSCEESTWQDLISMEFSVAMDDAYIPSDSSLEKELV